jgi:hypothetical protein
MAFSDFLKERAEKAEAEYQEKIRPEYKALLNLPRQLTFEELPERMNSYEREAFYAKLDDRGLRLMTLKLMKNITAYPEHHKHRPASTYEEALLRVMLPLILERFGVDPQNQED